MNTFAGIALVLSLVSFASSVLSIVRLKGPMSVFLLIPKLIAAAMTPWTALLGLLAGGLGLFSRSRVLMGLNLLLGGAAAFLSIRYIRGVIAPHAEFEAAFGPNWRDRIGPTLRERLPQRRWPIYLPDPPQPRWERDVAFWTIPGTKRKLLCDLWSPLATVPPSRLAVIYLHGSAWCLLDKDSGTRSFFRHLCAQGHFVMDVAYRLMPETNIEGMVGDVKRAVAWLKAHAAEYGIDPERIVLVGGSAGGHLSLLAGYTPHHLALTPEDVRGVDLSVRAVISYYGPSDMRAFYDYADWEHVVARSDGISNMINRNPFLRRLLPGGDSPDRNNFKKGMAALPHLFPGAPDEAPEWFALVSPVEYVRSDCPATLLLYGGGDFVVPPAAVRALSEKLRAAGVPAMCVVFPQAEHAFDVLPRWSPAAQASFYDVDHFLALMA